MDNFGLISIITPSYNCSNFIIETIESIQAQTYKNWELLITDDCSTDNSCKIIEEYTLKDNRIKLFKFNSNLGAGAARNNSIQEAKGQFIAFCDSDDRWYPNKLEEQLIFMTKNGCALSYTSYDTCDEKGNIKGWIQCPKKMTLRKIIRNNDIGCLTAMYNVGKIGKHLMPTIRKRQDWCLWIKIIKEHGDAYGIQKSLAIYRIREESISANKIEMLKYNYNVYNQILGYNKLISLLILGGYFIPYYLYKKIKQKYNYKQKLTLNH